MSSHEETLCKFLYDRTPLRNVCNHPGHSLLEPLDESTEGKPQEKARGEPTGSSFHGGKNRFQREGLGLVGNPRLEIRRKESAVGRGVASLSYHHGVQGTPKSRKKEKVQRCRGSKTIALLQKKTGLSSWTKKRMTGAARTAKTTRAAIV